MPLTACKAEVGQLDHRKVEGNKDIPWLYVPMSNTRRVNCYQAARNIADYPGNVT